MTAVDRRADKPPDRRAQLQVGQRLVHALRRDLHVAYGLLLDHLHVLAQRDRGRAHVLVALQRLRGLLVALVGQRVFVLLLHQALSADDFDQLLAFEKTDCAFDDLVRQLQPVGDLPAGKPAAVTQRLQAKVHELGKIDARLFYGSGLWAK